MLDRFNWGILGPGRIAQRFAADLERLPDARLLAVGSRSAERAESFASAHGAQRAYDSYAALASDPDVQAIYVATPHPFHLETAQLCLQQGKAVLCEKPLAANLAQTESLVASARQHGAFLMEAMWTRFNPVMIQVRTWLAEGRIGEPRLVTADFGFAGTVDPASRLFNPALAGGALLDVGVYVVSLAHMVFGSPPTRIKATAAVGETGVDEQTALALAFAGGGLASLTCAICTNTPQMARIDGTGGRITIPAFWHATEATLEPLHGEPITTRGDASYHYEAAEVMACVRAARLESDAMPLDESIAIAATLDAARHAVGVRYPFDAR
ncbi:MAG: Gfo/Idh/MocA family oxidoreductase [Chloroflexi bacterium]|jgi:dihydrodiol dehydrogenase / D-xylose 1-dehydrogenase (NADP)|nr:Gfo/Idh/MocA family oxidoreductase [Chloroflexota bacterium]